MTWYALGFLPPQYEKTDGKPYVGAVMKAYAAQSSTPIPFATSTDGSTLASSLVLNAAGYPTYNGTIVIPHVQEDFKLALYPNQAAADADSGAVWTLDDIKISANSNETFYNDFDGTGAQATFTLSQDLGNDERILTVFADRPLPEYQTNGDFTTNSDWTLAANITISGGVANFAAATSNAMTQNANKPLIQGMAYAVETVVTRSAGGVTASIGGTAGVERVAAGTYKEVIIAGSTQAITYTGNAFTGTVDSVRVRPMINPRREYIRPDEMTLVGNQLTLNFFPPQGTKNVIVTAPSLAVGAANNAAAAAAVSEANALSYKDEAEDWANKVNGDVASTGEYSAKAYAIGGTGVTATSTKGAAKEWATKTSASVDTVDYSAKEYAQGTQAATGGSAKNWAQQIGADVTGAALNSRSAKSWAQDNLAGATLGGSAKDWAQSASLPDGTNKSAKSYAADSGVSAAAALVSQNAAASSQAIAQAAAAVAFVRYRFDSATGMADPGTGDLRRNNGSQSLTTSIAISNTDADGNNVAGYLAAMDDSNHTPRALLKIAKDINNFEIYNITGANVDNSGWKQLTVTYSYAVGNLSNNDPVYIGYVQSGNDGAGGDVSSIETVTVDGQMMVANGITGKSLKKVTSSGYPKLTSGVPAYASTIPLTDIATQGANTITGNFTGSTAAPTANTVNTNEVVLRQSSNLAGKSMGVSTILARLATGDVKDASVAEINTLLGNSSPIKAFVNFDGTVAANISGTYNGNGTSTTFSVTNHGHIVGHRGYADFTSGGGNDGIYTVTSVTNANTFVASMSAFAATSGNVTLNRQSIRKAYNVAHVATLGVSGGSGADYEVNYSTAMTTTTYLWSPAIPFLTSTSLTGTFWEKSVVPTLYGIHIRGQQVGGSPSSDVYMGGFVVEF